ncbi:MAG: hypothetical protein AB2989_04750 [Candidatus Symbiodolus clandestinus]
MDDYLLGFSANKGRDNVSLLKNPGVQVEKTGKSILLEKGRHIARYELNKEIEKAILTTITSRIAETSESNSEELNKTLLERSRDDTESLLFQLSQSTDKLYLQQATELCDDLILEYTDICNDKNPLGGIIKIVEKRLDLLENEEIDPNSNATQIKSDHDLLNDDNSNLLKSLEVTVSQGSNNKNLLTESTQKTLNKDIRHINDNFENLKNRRLVENEFDKVITRVTANRELLAISQLSTKNISVKELLTDFLKKLQVDKLNIDDRVECRIKDTMTFLKKLTHKYYTQHPNVFRKIFLRASKNHSITDKKLSALSQKINAAKEIISFVFPNKENLHEISSIKKLPDGNEQVINKNTDSFTAQTADTNNKADSKNIYKAQKDVENSYENKAEKELFDQLKDILKKITISNTVNEYLEKIGAEDLIEDYLLCERELKKDLNLKEIFEKLTSILKKIIEHELAWKSRSENPCDASIRLRELLNTVNKLLDKYKASGQKRPSKLLDWLENYRQQLAASEKLADKECKNRKIVSSNR